MTSDWTAQLHPRSRIRRWAVCAALVLLLVGGWWEANWRGRVVDGELRESLIRQATAITRTIDAAQLKSLSFAPADQANPAYHQLCAQMSGYRSLIGCQGIYTLALDAGELRFGPESYTSDDPQASPPGAVYQQPTPAQRAIFNTGRAFTEGPFTDQFGTFVSAFAPLRDGRTGAVLFAIGVDVEAADWQAAVRRAQIFDGAFALLLAAILATGEGVLRWRERRPGLRGHSLRYAEPCLVAAMGVSATLAAALFLHREGLITRRDAFLQVAEMQATHTVERFHDLQVEQVGALARFFDASNHVDRDEFSTFTIPMIEYSPLQALSWIPAIPAADKAAVEAQARLEGFENFSIWQKNAIGDVEPAVGREYFFPIRYVEPRMLNALALGYDLGSEPLRRAALQRALATGLPIATDPVTLVHSPSKPMGIVAFHPVFAGEGDTRTPRGLAVAAIPFKSLQIAGSVNAPAVVKLLQLTAGEPARFLVSSCTEDNLRHAPGTVHEAVSPVSAGGISALYPLFAFGNSYALALHPTAAFLAVDPLQAGLPAALIGLLLTALLTAYAASVTRRRADLEAQVQTRTAQVRESEQLLANIISKIPIYVFWKDRNSVFLGCNNRFAQAAGLADPAEVCGKTDYDLAWTREQSDQYRRNDAEVMTTGVALLDVEETQRQDDGSEAVLLTSKVPLRDKDGKVMGVLGIFADITPRKRMEERLRLQGSALASAASAVVITDLTGRICWVNPAFTRLTGYTYAESLGQLSSLLKSDRHDADFYKKIWATISAGQVWHGEIINRRKDGTCYHEEMTITPVRNDNAQITHFVAIKQDITDRVRAQHLAGERDQLRDAVKAHEQVLGVVGHELRTPLAGLLMITEFLQIADDRASAEFDSFLHSAHDEIKRMAGLVNDLLEVARINSGVARWNWGPVDLHRACTAAAASIAPLIDPQRIVLTVCVDPPDLCMRGDEAAIRRLVLNLVSNASKHTTDGAITVTVQRVEENGPARVELRVADTGAGMCTETAARLGVAFALNSGVVGERYIAGSGLGLAICRGIVDAHGGSFSVKSELNAGTTCSVLLRTDLPTPHLSDTLVEIATGTEI